jgi:HD-GYP domain-containing protein (c-di-GMP phosphodiesterase class II)
MRNYENDVVGAVQLINAKRSFETKLTVDNVPNEVVSFGPEDLEMIESIASQVAVALDNKNLLDSVEVLFDGFVRTSLSALALRDPSAAGRSYRVEALTTSLARAVSGTGVGKYRDVRLTEDQFKELRYACLLHDVGVIGVREQILIKAKKLLPGQLELIQARFDFLVRSVQLKFATEKLAVKHNGKGSSQRLEDVERRLAQEIGQLHRWMAAIVQANEPSVLSEDTAAILEQLSKQTFQDLSGTPHPMLDPQEFRILSIRKGVLDPLERLEMESHVTHSFEFVSTIPWPPSMRNIPEIVYTHHERLDGSGYPRGLTGDQISLQARMLTIADIYDALTAQDRPYKRAVPTEVALEILRAEANDGKLDKDLLDIFVSKEVFLTSSDRPAAAEAPRPPVQKRDLITDVKRQTVLKETTLDLAMQDAGVAQSRRLALCRVARFGAQCGCCAVFGQGKKLFVGHRAPQEIREPAGQSEVVERSRFLTEKQKLRRCQHSSQPDVDSLFERTPLGQFGLDDGKERLDVVVGHSPPKCAADEFSKNKFGIGRRGIRDHFHAVAAVVGRGRHLCQIAKDAAMTLRRPGVMQRTFDFDPLDCQSRSVIGVGPDFVDDL